MAASLIDRLPEDDDINRAELESIARNVCGVAYVGESALNVLGCEILTSYWETLYSWS